MQQQKKVGTEGKAEKKKSKKKKKGEAYVIEVVSEKTEVTEFYATRVQQLLSGKKLPDINEEEKETVPIDKEEDKHLKELIKQYEETQEELSVEDKRTLDDELKEVEEAQKERDQYKDQFFELFQWVSLQDQKQILRYTRHYPGISPLWYGKTGILPRDGAEKCRHCGGKMVFEFQVMPQLFNYFPQLVRVDWGTVVVYTCEKSCVEGGRYGDEFVFIQYVDEVFK
eukprot:TRINITY_DN446_c0_g1_i4.p2 TRINITY_DN446_c0_g1~~TRINITY_DN446_c0_g1_i4.p2  ORF type:complete len:226 (+),score=76.78 TRINITY_DN446_c0_g1_i4:342-1019(+)